jgi:hypothetical protein
MSENHSIKLILIKQKNYNSNIYLKIVCSYEMRLILIKKFTRKKYFN